MEGAGVPKKKLKTTPLTPAERSKRYRERMKQGNPEKFKDLQKKNLERAKQLYKTKTAVLTEEQKEERREKWREFHKQRGVPKTTYNFKLPLTPAEKSKRYREILKQDNSEKFKDLQKNNLERAKQLYKKKTAVSTEEQKEERRKTWREYNKQRGVTKSTYNFKLPLTPAEKSRRYRERLKQDNPEKFKDLQKKNLERAKRLYKTKTAVLTDEQKEERRKTWRECNKQRGVTKSTYNIKLPLTPAEKSKRYRERLKQANPEKFKDLQKKNLERAKRLYKTKTAVLTDEQKEERRKTWREYNKQRGVTKSTYNIKLPLTPAEKSKRYRERLKQANPEKFKDLQKKNLERAKRLYKTKTAVLTEEQKEDRRKTWREYRKQRGRPNTTNTKTSQNTTTAWKESIARDIQKRIEHNLRKENTELRNSIQTLQKSYNSIFNQLKEQQTQMAKINEDYEVLMKRLQRAALSK